jgi:hypothetical protein
LKKPKPITLKRSEIRKSVRKPMPKPAQTHADQRRKKLQRIIDAEARAQP